MTLHQLTQAASFELDLGAAEAGRRLIARVASGIAGWRAARRAEGELASLDHRERADLASRR
ncbi:MAG: hypothetical protein HY055_00225 [Magnetospirillum sp.]|nr:hypothetical protein [Magnetospirillum sp.]